MRKIWFAVALGVLLGSGLALTSPSTFAPSARTALEVALPQEASKAQPPADGAYFTLGSVDSVLLAILAGLILGVPIFLVAKKRIE